MKKGLISLSLISSMMLITGCSLKDNINKFNENNYLVYGNNDFRVSTNEQTKTVVLSSIQEKLIPNKLYYDSQKIIETHNSKFNDYKIENLIPKELNVLNGNKITITYNKYSEETIFVDLEIEKFKYMDDIQSHDKIFHKLYLKPNQKNEFVDLQWIKK